MRTAITDRLPTILMIGMMTTMWTTVSAQNRTFQTGKIAIDDDGADGTWNTMTIRAPDSLAQNVILTIPDIGSGSAQFMLMPSGSSGAWLLGGNGGTSAGIDYLGTDDSTALHLYVNGGANNALILNTNGSIQRGVSGNARGAGAIDLQNVSSGFFDPTQVASGVSASIAGGVRNTGSGQYSAIGGGLGNTASGSAATVSGGGNNRASQSYSTVGGGFQNVAEQAYTTVSGGSQNTASLQQATVGGGFGNTASATGATVAGGWKNSAAGTFSAIPGGFGLTLSGNGSFGFNAESNPLVPSGRPMTVSEPKTAVFGNADLWLANNDGAASRLRFYEANSDTGAFPTAMTFYTSFEAGDQATDINYTLPTAPPAVDGQVLSSAMNGVMSWVAASTPGWDVTGNSGTTAGANYIGTNDSQSFQIHVDNDSTNGTDGRGRVMRFEPNMISPNIVGGFQGNSVTSAAGATVSGGGSAGNTNSIASSFGTIGGGRSNKVMTPSEGSTISGGSGNVVDSSSGATIGGGASNTIVGRIFPFDSAHYSTIGGGQGNSVVNRSRGSTIAGGIGNIIDSSNGSTIGGGLQNTIEHVLQATVAGGFGNSIGAGATRSVIGGGDGNTIGSNTIHATISGGGGNVVGSGSAGSVVGGGSGNRVGEGARLSAIPGGKGLTLNGQTSFGYLANNSGARDMTIESSAVAVFGNTNLWLANNDGSARSLRFYEAETDTGTFPSGTHYTSFEAGDQSEDLNYILPTARPASDGQILSSDTNGVMSWTDAGSWSLTGNAGTTSGTNYVGTSDSTVLRIYVNGGTANALTLNTNGSLQHGDGSIAMGLYAVDLQFGAIAGGGATARSSTIGGGEQNLVSNLYGTVSGGTGNAVTGRHGTIGGGIANRVSGTSATVGGGYNNIADASYSVVVGGRSNSTEAGLSTVLGGRNLILEGAASGSVGFLGDPDGVGPMRISQRQVAVFGNTDLWLANNDGGASRLVFFAANSVTGSFPNTDSGAVHSTSFRAGDQSEDISYILPTIPPSSNDQVLSGDTNGVMTWIDGPTGAQSFSNASAATPTLALANSAGTNDGTALAVSSGKVVLASGQGGPANIPDNVNVYDVDDGTAASSPTVGLPVSGMSGQILYVYVSDPDGATVGGGVRASGDRLTWVYIGGAWQLFHVN